MINFTPQMLQTLGITIDEANADSLITHLNETIEERVGLEITDSLDEDQLLDLAVLHETASDDKISSWLEQNVPDFKQIVSDTIDIVIGETAQHTASINAVAA